MDRSNCIEGVKIAMDSEDYEAAARYISTYSDLDGDAPPLELGQAEEQAEVLGKAGEQLVEVIRQRFKAAVEKQDHQAVLRFTKLYVPLSLGSEGLAAFSGYLCQLISTRSTEDYSTLADAVGQDVAAADFVGVLTNLFKDIAVAVEENEAMVKELFGSKGLIHIIQKLQAECDNSGSRILRRYLEHRQLQRLVKEISSSKRMEPNIGSPERTSVVDPRQVEAFLDEIVMVSQRSEEYNAYMLGKLRDAAGADNVGSLARENSFKGGQFNCTVREVIGYYITMEDYYLEEMVSKAISLDELGQEQLISSMVDDSFFIVQKCARRSLATNSLQCVCAMLTELNNLLSGGYKTALAGRMANGAQRLMAGMPTDASIYEGPLPERPHDVASIINSAETSGTYTMKLRQELESYALELFTGSQDRERLKSCLADLTKTSSDFHSMAAKALDSVAAGLFPRFRPSLEVLGQMNYQPSESEYAQMEMEETWTQRLLISLEASLTWLRPMLVVSNYENLVACMVDKLVARLEAVFTKKKFNQLGGLLLDKDVRTLVSHLSEFTQRTVRDKFARLTQMATVLSLETPSEILDYWGENSGPITWRFTGTEVLELMSLRVDFTMAALSQLSL